MATDPRLLFLEGYDVNAGNLRKRMISERALMSNDYDIPLSKLIGGYDSALGKFGFGAVTDTKYEWMYDGPLPVSVALAGALDRVTMGTRRRIDAIGWRRFQRLSLMGASRLCGS